VKIKTFVVGILSANCYLVHCRETKDAIIIDPGFDSPSEAERIFSNINEEKLNVKFIVNTHGHSDHVGGNAILKKKFNVPVCIHANDAEIINSGGGLSIGNILLKEGDVLRFGDAILRVIHTPGHTPGSICLLGGEVVFTGDTLFAGGIGRTDFAGGSDRDMEESLKKLVRLPANLVVFPGHGPASTIGEEKVGNPFLRWL
jgi:glyoxylase-like metal-dependent hydrolase (beta-lactamase superfamily II)